jgi:hypothetical protein
MKMFVSVIVVGLLFAACTQTPRANLPGESAPPTQSPPPLTTAPATQPPATTPAPRRAFKIGEPIAFTDGWRLTVMKVEDQAAQQFFTPKPGTHYVAVTVRHDNGSPKAVSFNSFYFKVQDSAGVRRDGSIFGTRDDSLKSGELAPGAFVVGSLTFEVPVGDTKLQLIYEQFGYAQTTIELY